MWSLVGAGGLHRLWDGVWSGEWRGIVAVDTTIQNPTKTSRTTSPETSPEASPKAILSPKLSQNLHVKSRQQTSLGAWPKSSMTTFRALVHNSSRPLAEKRLEQADTDPVSFTLTPSFQAKFCDAPTPLPVGSPPIAWRSCKLSRIWLFWVFRAFIWMPRAEQSSGLMDSGDVSKMHRVSPGMATRLAAPIAKQVTRSTLQLEMLRRPTSIPHCNRSFSTVMTTTGKHQRGATRRSLLTDIFRQVGGHSRHSLAALSAAALAIGRARTRNCIGPRCPPPSCARFAHHGSVSRQPRNDAQLKHQPWNDRLPS